MQLRNTPSNVTITAVILTLNEELALPSALHSLQWCHEILVLDSGSTDSTIDVALAHRARVVTHRQPNPFNITHQRNYALQNCGITSDWVLFLDADETIGYALKEEIVDTISSDPPFDAFHLAPRYWFFGRWLRNCQSYPSWHPRLLKRGQAYFTGGVWESFNVQARVGTLSNPYEHFSFSKGIDDWLLKHCRYADWEARSVLGYLQTNRESSFQTRRSLFLRKLAAHLWPLRPLLRFLQKYIINRGFLDGWQGLLFCMLCFCYELVVVVKILESFISINNSRLLDE